MSIDRFVEELDEAILILDEEELAPGIELVLDRDGIRGTGDGPKGPRGGGRSTEEAQKELRGIDDQLKELYKARDAAKAGIKAAKAGEGPGLSKFRKERAATNKKIAELEAKAKEIQDELRFGPKQEEPETPEQVPAPKPETPEGYTPHERPVFKNFKDAKAHLQKEYGLVASTTMSENAKVGLRYTQMASNEMASMSDQFEKVDKFAKGEKTGNSVFNVSNDTSLVVAGLNYNNENVGGDYTHQTGNINVFSGRLRMGNEDRPCRLGDGNVDFTGQGVFRHEYGHKVWYQALKTSEREEFTAVAYKYCKGSNKNSTFRGDSFGSRIKEGKRKVSSYATTNVSEMWAESFTAITHPRYADRGGGKGDGIPADLEETMYKILGKR